MNKAQRIQLVRKTLDDLYPSPPIPLNHKDPYTLLVAVLLSAQCTDVRINQVTPLLFKKADTPKKMVKLGIEKILEIIRPCGLGPAKSANIHALSKIILERHDSAVPNSFGALEALPGVGHKTASVVMSHAFKVPAFPVDTHIHRLMARWKLSNGKSVIQTEKDCKKVFPESEWEKRHLQIIFFGREYCPARNHKVAECPICGSF